MSSHEIPEDKRSLEITGPHIVLHIFLFLSCLQ